MGLSRWYKRWRHGLGFGVHSPYAYRMVREVLRPPRGYAYYAADRLPHAELRLLYRILVDLRPAIVGIAAGEQKLLLQRLVEMALPETRITDSGTPDMMIVHGQTAVATDAAGADIIYFNDTRHPLLAEIAVTLERGHIYRNPTRALVVRDVRLPAQVFDIRF